MIIESENTPETDATPELVDALLHNAGRRGAWLVLIFLAAFVAALLAVDLVIRFELYFIANLDPVRSVYADFIHTARDGDWSALFAGLFGIGFLPVPIAAAAICTTVWKTFRKAVLRAALFSAIAEAVWFFPLAAGAHC